MPGARDRWSRGSTHPEDSGNGRPRWPQGDACVFRASPIVQQLVCTRWRHGSTYSADDVMRSFTILCSHSSAWRSTSCSAKRCTLPRNCAESSAAPSTGSISGFVLLACGVSGKETQFFYAKSLDKWATVARAVNLLSSQILTGQFTSLNLKQLSPSVEGVFSLDRFWRFETRRI